MAYNDNDATEETFDLNDPRLMDDTPTDFDPEAGIEDVKFAPPDDGPNWVVLRLREQTREDKPSISVRPLNKEAEGIIRAALERGEEPPKGLTKVMLTISPRLLKEDGTEGAFMKEYYPSTQVFKGQSTSHLAHLCAILGKPLARTMTNRQIVEHVTKLFADAGDEGIKVVADTRWNKSFPELDENQMPVYKNGQKQYVEVKGQKTIQAQAVRAAKLEAQAQGLEGEAFDRFVDAAKANAHVYSDPLTGEERTVRLEINRLIGVE